MTKDFSINSFIAGIALGVLAPAGWFMNGSLPSIFTSTNQTPTEAVASTTESGAVSVADQPAGMTVSVESVTVPPPGVWIAVRETNGNDLGNVLGAARVTGPKTDVSIPLLRATTPGLSYAVELYRDDGDGTFDLSGDSVYVDFQTGNPVIEYFTTTQ